MTAVITKGKTENSVFPRENQPAGNCWLRSNKVPNSPGLQKSQSGSSKGLAQKVPSGNEIRCHGNSTGAMKVQLTLGYHHLQFLDEVFT